MVDQPEQHRPRAPLSDPVGTLSEKNGVATQSFEIRENTPKQVMDFYEKVLPAQGWTASMAPTPSGHLPTSPNG